MRGRLLLLVLAIAAPALLLVVVLVRQAYRNEREAVGLQLSGTARAIAALVDRQMAESEALLRGLAASPNLAQGDFRAFDAQARSVIAGPERWVVLFDPEGQQLANTRLPPDSVLPRLTLGTELLETVTQGKTFISNIVVGPTLKREIVYVVLPVMQDGRLKYALSYAMFPSAFAGAMNPTRFSAGTVISILDREGVIVVRHPNPERYVGGKPMADIMRAALSRQESVQESVTLEGTRVMAAISPAPVSGWSVALGVPLTSLYLSARNLIWLGVLGSGVLLGVSIMMAAWIGRALVRGVDTLVDDTELVGRGVVPPMRSGGLEETDFVAGAMRKTALRLEERGRENAALNAALQVELEKQKSSVAAIRQLAAIVSSSDDAIISKDLDGVIVTWNRGAERIFGYKAEEAIGRPIFMLLPPGREQEEAAILQRLRHGETLDHFETIRRRKDGSLVPISLMVSPLRDEQGVVVGVSKIARDISQRHHAEAQQRAIYELVARVNQAAELPAIYEAALDAMERCMKTSRAAILLADEPGAMRFVASRGLSDTYRKVAEGHSPWPAGETDVRPVWIDDIATHDLPASLRAALEQEGIRALAFIPLSYEKRLLGKFMVYLETPHRFSAEELQPVETIASQVAFAIERQRSAAALEALVSERTASLRQVIEQMEEFSYSVSHDLRAPVRAMRGYADIILQEHSWRLDGEARDLLTRIVQNGNRMDRLIRDLLTYSRVSRRELRLEPVSLDRLFHDVPLQYPELGPDRADIEVAGPLPDVIAHEPSLAQVVSNLLSNAVKFVPPGRRPRVRVGVEPRGPLARFWVADNGIGIKPEHQSRLFGLFERIHPEHDYEGTGIGLAIVRRAVERMNGRVGVESDGVSGSTFWFELPVERKT